MNATDLTLDIIDITSPCTANWENMRGDDVVRNCQQCQLNVYNLSGMTRDEASELIQTHEGRLCGRFYRRADGTIVTKDCPVGLRAVRRRLARAIAAITALAAFLFAGTSFAVGQKSAQKAKSGPLAVLLEWMEPPLDATCAFMGEIYVAPTTLPTSVPESTATIDP